MAGRRSRLVPFPSEMAGSLRDGAVSAWPIIKVILPIIVVAAWLGGLYGYWHYERYVNESSPAICAPLPGRQAPEWMTVADVRRISRLGAVVEGRSIYDGDLASDLGSAYLGNAWVRRVVAIRREFPDKVDVVLELRRPVAYVKSNRYYAVGRYGVRLPSMPAPIAGRGVPVVSGVAGPVPPVGEPWNSEALTDALDALSAVTGSVEGTGEGETPAVTIAHVRVSEAELPGAGRTTEIEFVTAGGMKIVWGRHSRRETKLYGQLSTSDKIAVLRRQLEKIGAGPRKARYINVTFSPGTYGLFSAQPGGAEHGADG